MNLEDILAELGKLEASASIIDAVKALDVSDDVTRLKGELESEQGKHSGILADKKKFKDRMEKAESDLKKIETDKLPADERHERELKELQDKLSEEQTAREEQDVSFKAQQRDAKLVDLTGSIKWADGTPSSTAKLVIKNALTDVQDLSDEKAVDAILAGIKETHKSFIAADAPGGTGSKQTGGDKGGGNDDAPATMQDLVDDAWAGK